MKWSLGFRTQCNQQSHQEHKSKRHVRGREKERDAQPQRSELTQSLCVFLCHSGVSKQCQSLTARHDQWRQAGHPHTHTSVSQHMLRHAYPPKPQTLFTRAAYAYLFVCVYVSVYEYTIGALSERHAPVPPAMRNIQRRTRARRKQYKVTERATLK